MLEFKIIQELEPNTEILEIIKDYTYETKNGLEENIECLIKVKNRFHYLGYFKDAQAIGTKIEYLKSQNTTLKKYISIENDKDNAD